MKIEITTREYKEIDVPFEYPFYRAKYVSEDEAVYYKFESENVATRIHDKIGETSIMSYNDPNSNIVKDWITSEDMLFGYGAYSVIPKPFFTAALRRLQNTIDNV